MLAGVAIGVSSEAAPATATSINTDCGEMPMLAAADNAMGTTIKTVAVLLTTCPRTAVSTNSASINAYGPRSPTMATIHSAIRSAARWSGSRSTAGSARRSTPPSATRSPGIAFLYPDHPQRDHGSGSDQSGHCRRYRAGGQQGHHADQHRDRLRGASTEQKVAFAGAPCRANRRPTRPDQFCL